MCRIRVVTLDHFVFEGAKEGRKKKSLSVYGRLNNGDGFVFAAIIRCR